MDVQFWIYVVIGVIYFLSRALKKQLPKEVQDTLPESKRAEAPVPPTEKPRQITFEELLKEITESKQPQKPVYQPVSSKPEVIDYDDDLKDEMQDLEEVEVDEAHESKHRKDKLYDVYEEAKREAFMRPSLEETLNVRDTPVQFGKFKVFEQEKQRTVLDDYLKEFQDPEGLKKAVIMSEILNRKF